MFGKKGDIPPYEIMRHGGREARKRAASEWRGPRRADASEGLTNWRDWMTGGEPVILRLPKGMALVIAGGVVLLIVLAYWVGHARGGAAADARNRQNIEAAQLTLRTAPTPVFIDPGIADAPPDAEAAGSPGDPRIAGLNYLILAQYPEAEARRLAAFLAERGVETFLTNSNNAQLYLVVGMQGFEGKTAGEAYEQRLRRLGRAWRAHNGGRGEDLGSMWWKKHQSDQ